MYKQPPTKYGAPSRSSVQVQPYHDWWIRRLPSHSWLRPIRVATALAGTRGHCPSSRLQRVWHEAEPAHPRTNLTKGGRCHLFGRRESLGETKESSERCQLTRPQLSPRSGAHAESLQVRRSVSSEARRASGRHAAGMSKPSSGRAWIPSGRARTSSEEQSFSAAQAAAAPLERTSESGMPAPCGTPVASRSFLTSVQGKARRAAS